MSFIGYYSLHLKSAFAAAGGYRGQKRDPLNNSVSLDMPLGEDADGDTLMDIQPDPVDLIADEESQQWREQLHEALDAAMGTLPEEQADTLRRRFYQDQTLKEVSQGAGVGPEQARQWEYKGLRTLRRPMTAKHLRPFLHPDDVHAAGLQGTGLSAFRQSGVSATERAAFAIIEGKQL